MSSLYDVLVEEEIRSRVLEAELDANRLRALMLVSDALLERAEQCNLHDRWPPPDLVSAIWGLAGTVRVEIEHPYREKSGRHPRQLCVDGVFRVQEALLELLAPGWDRGEKPAQEAG